VSPTVEAGNHQIPEGTLDLGKVLRIVYDVYVCAKARTSFSEKGRNRGRTKFWGAPRTASGKLIIFRKRVRSEAALPNIEGGNANEKLQAGKKKASARHYLTKVKETRRSRTRNQKK